VIYLFKTPVYIQKLFPKNIWRKETDQKTLYLSFDDGPTPEVTDWVLKNLQKYNAKATFFCLGKNIENHTELAQKLLQSPHRIANHSYAHPNGWLTKTTSYCNDIQKAQKIIEYLQENLKAKQEKIFRPPYGKISFLQAKNLRKKGFKVVLWEVLSGDFDKKLSPQKSLQKVLKNTRSGSIIVFHDSKKAFKTLEYVLPKALAYWSKKGYIFETI